ncbi:MAG: hypothetical protein V1913_10465 [Fibrobacterota bacterium]
MQIQSVTPDLARFLELKKAAEKRMAVGGTSTASTVRAPQATVSTDKPAGASFMDLIKALRGNSDNNKSNGLNMAPVSKNTRATLPPRTTSPMHIAPVQKQAKGLLSAYTVSRLASEAVNATGASQDTPQNTPKLGKLFDAIA